MDPRRLNTVLGGWWGNTTYASMQMTDDSRVRSNLGASSADDDGKHF